MTALLLSKRKPLFNAVLAAGQAGVVFAWDSQIDLAKSQTEMMKGLMKGGGDEESISPCLDHKIDGPDDKYPLEGEGPMRGMQLYYYYYLVAQRDLIPF